MNAFIALAVIAALVALIRRRAVLQLRFGFAPISLTVDYKQVIRFFGKAKIQLAGQGGKTYAQVNAQLCVRS
jgi:hypothetical protein